MPKKIVKETPVKNQTGKKIKKAVDDALIAAVHFSCGSTLSHLSIREDICSFSD